MPTIVNQSTSLNAIARGGLLNLIGLITAFLFNFIFQLVLTRSLSTADVGLYNLGFTIAGLISLMIVFGLDRTVIRFIAFSIGIHDRGRESGTIIYSILLIVIIALLLIPIIYSNAEFIALGIFDKQDFEPVLRVFILSAPFIASTRLLMGILQGYKNVKPMVIIEQIVSPLLRLVLLIIVFLYFANSSLLVSFTFLGASVIGLMISIIIFQQHLASQKKMASPTPILYELLSFTWPIFGASMLNRTNNQIEVLLLGMFSTSDQVAIFTVCLKITITITIFFQAINLIFGPFITELFSHMQYNQLIQQYRIVTRWVFTLTLPFGLILLLEAPDIMALFGEDYVQGVPILRILTISQLVYAIVGPVSLVLIMTRHNKLNLIDLIVTLIISLILDLVLIPWYGVYGAAIAFTMAVCILNTLQLIQVYTHFKIQPYSKGFLSPIVAGLLASLATIFIALSLRDTFYILRLIILSSTLLLTYSIVILKFGLEITDREAIKSIIHRIKTL